MTFQSNEAMKSVSGMILKRVGTMTMNKVTTTEVATAMDTSPILTFHIRPTSGLQEGPEEVLKRRRIIAPLNH